MFLKLLLFTIITKKLKICKKKISNIIKNKLLKINIVLNSNEYFLCY